MTLCHDAENQSPSTCPEVMFAQRVLRNISLSSFSPILVKIYVCFGTHWVDRSKTSCKKIIKKSLTSGRVFSLLLSLNCAV